MRSYIVQNTFFCVIPLIFFFKVVLFTYLFSCILKIACRKGQGKKSTRHWIQCMSYLPFIFGLCCLYLLQSPKNKLSILIFYVNCFWTFSFHACRRGSLLGTVWLFFIDWFKFKSTLLFKTLLFLKNIISMFPRL